MSERKEKIYTAIFVFVVLLLIIYYALTRNENLLNQKENLQDKNWVYEHVRLSKSDYGDHIDWVEKDEDIQIFNPYYQQAVTKKIQEKEEKAPDFKNSYMIYNPYGTNKNSINIYFKTEENLSLEYTVHVEGFQDFTRTLKNEGENNLTTDHAYQLIGLIVGKKNKLTLKLLNENQEEVDQKEVEIDLSDVKTSVATKLKTKQGESTEELSDGLYVMFGHDKAYNANNYLYDNDGVLRSELVLEGYRSDRIIFLENNQMLYSDKENGFILVNRLGEIVRKYNIGNYIMHHDYVYDEENNSLLILANKKGADTIEDRVLALNLETGKTREVMDMKDYFEEFYKQAVRPEKNTYGGTELDWIHLNSLDVIQSKDVILSSRELSTLIYVKDIYTNPKIAYVITDPSTLEKSSIQDLNLEKEGDFVSQAGQHTITYQEKDSDSYYLYMYNNNYQGARTRPKFNWKNYPGTGTYQKGEASYYYKYLVREEDHTYELVEKVALPYSSIVSSVEQYQDHLVTSSGMSHCFNEYDEENQLIKQFNYTSKKYAYRIFKYDFKNIWFS